MKNKSIILLCLFLFVSCSKDKKVPVSKIIIDNSCTIYMGEIKELQATIFPKNATDIYATWISSNDQIATVKYQGVLTGIREGTAEITATIDGVISNICLVTVLYRDIPIEHISIKPVLFMVKGGTIKIEPKIEPEYTTEETITWTSSDESVATINTNGEITALREGTIEITGSSQNATSNTCVLTIIKEKVLVIPNGNFKKILLAQYDSNKDGVFSQQDALNVDVLNIESSYQINSLEGIQYFYNLTELHCSNNFITELDLSNNREIAVVVCKYNQLNSIKLNEQSPLVELNCYSNNLTSLNLPKTNQLRRLYCGNNSISRLDLSNFNKLNILHCENNNLTVLNTSTSSDLTTLDCSDNLITLLILPELFSIMSLSCNNNRIETLNIPNNYSLEDLYCQNNSIKKLDIQDCHSLIEVNANNNEISIFITQSKNTLKYLWIDNNKLSKIEPRLNSHLVELHCANNRLSGDLNVAFNNDLKDLICFGNNLSKVIVKRGQKIWISLDEQTLLEEVD